MCALTLAALQGGNNGGAGGYEVPSPCGDEQQGRDGWPTPAGPCITLRQCCSGIDSAVVTSACEVVVTESYDDPCVSALEKLRTMGLCSTDGGASDGSGAPGSGSGS